MAGGGTVTPPTVDCDFGPVLDPPEHDWPYPFPNGSNTYWLVIPTFIPRQVGAEWNWNDSRDANRGVGDAYIEDGSTDKNGNPLYEANGDSNILAGDAYSYATDPNSFIAYWERLNYPRWKYPASYKKSRANGWFNEDTISWDYSEAWRTGGWERVEPYPCLGPLVQDEETGNYYIPVYTETTPAPTVNPESGEADELYYDNGYKADDNRYGYGHFVEHSIRYAEVPDDLTDYDLGIKPTWVRPFLAKFVKYNSFNWSYGNGHNGFEVHKDHYDEYDVIYGDGEDGMIAPVFLIEQRNVYTVDEGNLATATAPPYIPATDGLYKEIRTVTPVAQVYNRPRHKKYLGVTETIQIKKDERETNIEVDYIYGGSSVGYKFDITTASYTLSYGSEHIYEFDPNKPYDADPDRDASTPPPDYTTWPQGSLENVKYTGYANPNFGTAGYPEVVVDTPAVPPSSDFSYSRKGVGYGGFGWGFGGVGLANTPWTGLGPPTNGGDIRFEYSNFVPFVGGLSRMTYSEDLDSYNLTKFEYYGFGKVGAD